MSDSSLSPPPISPILETQEPAFPLLNGSSTQPPLESIFNTPLQPPTLRLPPTAAYIFMNNLFQRKLILGPPPQIQFQCTQPDCKYQPQSVPLKNTSTSNLLKHYQNSHPHIKRAIDHTPSIKRPFSSISIASTSLQSSNISSFFTPGKQQHIPLQAKYREFLLHFLVANNIALRAVESQSFIQMIQYLSLYIFYICI